MPSQSLTLNIPGHLYERIRERAERGQRSVEDETLELLTAAVPNEEALPGDVLAEVEELQHLDDDGLWRAARSHLAADAARELESLHFKQQRDGLTALEQETADALLRQYERAMVVRARATALL